MMGTAEATAQLPDPLRFAVAGIERLGGAVETEEPGGAPRDEPLALLPEGLRRELLLPEEVRLSAAPSGHATPESLVSCGLGSPLLSRLVADARAQTPVTAVRLALDAPRPAHAAALGDRAVIRNGLCEVMDVFPGEAVYVAASVAYTAEADDRHEGLVQVVVHAEDGVTPDRRLCALLDPAQAPSDAQSPLRPLPALPPAAAAAIPWILRRASGRVESALLPVRDAVQRRHARDHARVAEYFAALIDEAKRPRRKLSADAVATKLRHLQAERDTKLLDLQARFTLRVGLQPAALLCAVVPVVRVRLRARRRKGERELVTRLAAGAQVLDGWACDGCGGDTSRPALCDDQLHVLCERCAPVATGRPRCSRCRE